MKVGVIAPQERVEYLGEVASLGLSRIIGLLQATTETDDPLLELAADAREAGLALDA